MPTKKSDGVVASDEAMNAATPNDEQTVEAAAAAASEPPAPPTHARRATRRTKTADQDDQASSSGKESNEAGKSEEETKPTRRASSGTRRTTKSEAAVADESSEAAAQAVDSDAPAAEEQPAPRRRRGGRRVVRGAGAAGASLELKVEETPSARRRKTAAEPVETPEDADGNPQAADNEDEQPKVATRTRRRSARSTAETSDRPRRGYDDREIDDRRRRYDDEADDYDRRPRRSHRDDDWDDEEPRGSRSRRDDRDGRDDRDDLDGRSPRRRLRRNDDEARRDERAFEALDSLFSDHDDEDDRIDARGSRPMASLLFQEPVLPASRRRDDMESDEGDDYDDWAKESRSSRGSRSRRGPARDERDDRDGRNDGGSRRSNRSRDDQDDHDGRPSRQRAEREDGQETHDEAEESSRRGRSRRLNAQERRAAAEVEQIEEDLELDDIAYAPITEADLDDESDAPTRSRRRRRRSGSAQQQSGQEQQDQPDHQEADDNGRGHGGSEEEQSVTRRRRRRRSGRGEQDEDQIVARRSRKQQYIDEITDIEGSTRLEAKRQRRRDNRRERSRVSQLMEQDFLARRENVERLMVVREKEHHTQISVIEDNVLVEHYVSDIQEVATVGNIYLGRVQNVLPSMEAAFVDIGQSRNGVLYAGEVNWDAARLEGQPRRIELAFKSGDPVLVQVTKDPIGHKGARLTSQVTLAGRFLVLVPSGGMTGVSRKLSERERSRLKSIVSKIAPKDMGVIIRTAAEGASEEAITKDLENLVRQWERITAKRDEFLHGRRPKLLQGEPDVAIRVVRDIFNDDFSKLIVEGGKVYDRIEEYLDTMAPDLKEKLERWDPAEHEGKDVFDKWQIDSQLRKGMERQVYLPSGGSIVIDRTEAMTTIDVNTGRFIGKGKSLEETVTRCNLEASEEIARQLRLRDIGGMVMIDYVDMVMPANRDLVLRRLVECLARDRTKHQVAEVTSLGLVQMTRKRIGQGLVEAFSEECPTCKGRGFILHDEPTVSAAYDDPYALKGGDPFIKTNKHGQGTQVSAPQGSSPDVKAKLAAIAAAAVAANNAENEGKE